MIFRQLFERETSTWTWLLGDPGSGQAVLIDAVRECLDRDLTLLAELDLTLAWALETHVHADHVTAAALLRERTGCGVALGAASGVECADRLLEDGEILRFGALALEVRATPGHTAGCVSYVDHAHGRVFTGDALLIRGCGRTDFQGGDAATLYRSVRGRLFTLPDDTMVCPGHDYCGRTVSSIREERRYNPRLRDGVTEDAFVALMAELKLAWPRQIDVAVPANHRCGAP